MPPLERFPNSYFAQAGTEESIQLVDAAIEKDKFELNRFAAFEVTAMPDYEGPAPGTYDPRYILFVHRDDTLPSVLGAFLDQNGFMDAEVGEELKIKHQGI